MKKNELQSQLNHIFNLAQSIGSEKIDLRFEGSGDTGTLVDIESDAALSKEFKNDLENFAWEAVEASGIHNFGDGDEATMNMVFDIKNGSIELTHGMMKSSDLQDRIISHKSFKDALADLSNKFKELVKDFPSTCIHVPVYGYDGEADIDLDGISLTSGRLGSDFSSDLLDVDGIQDAVQGLIEHAEIEDFWDDEGGSLTLCFDLGKNEVWVMDAIQNEFDNQDDTKVKVASEFTICVGEDDIPTQKSI